MLDAALREHQPDEFQIVPDLEDAGILQHGLHGLDRLTLANLFGFEAVVEQALAGAAFAVGERNVTGFVRRHREREAAQRRLHRIDARVSVEIASTPFSIARAIQAFSRARSRTTSYLERSTGMLRTFCTRAAASEIGVAETSVAFPPPPDSGNMPESSPVFCGVAFAAVSLCSCGRVSGLPELSLESASICDASISAISATRRVRVENSIALRNAIRFL